MDPTTVFHCSVHLGLQKTFIVSYTDVVVIINTKLEQQQYDISVDIELIDLQQEDRSYLQTPTGAGAHCIDSPPL